MKSVDSGDNEEATSDFGKPKVKRRRRLSGVWVLPVVALVLGLWLVKNHFDNLGEKVKVIFPSAEGLAVGKTEVRCCLLYTSPSPRDQRGSRMPSSA